MMPMNGERLQKYNRLQRRELPRRRRRPPINKHHMTNACKGGKTTESNILQMKIERHATLHRYFRNMSWEEIGDALYQIFHLRDPQKCYEVIQRISRLKGRVA